MASVMLSSFGIRAYRNLLRQFLARAFINSISIIYNRLRQRHSLGRLWWWEGSSACTMCVAAALAKAIGIEAERPKCDERSEAGLELDSLGRKHGIVFMPVLITHLRYLIQHGILFLPRIIEECLSYMFPIMYCTL